jgi:hypothetical protein
VLAGCGSGSPDSQPVEPSLPRAAAQQLLARTQAVELALRSNDGCAAGRALATLRQATTELVTGGRVPPAFQAPLQAAVDDLAARPVPRCAAEPSAGKDDEPGHAKGHGKRGHKGKHD